MYFQLFLSRAVGSWVRIINLLIRQYLVQFHLGLGLLVALLILSSDRNFAYSLPPIDDIPEEILRTEVITMARSPIDGQPLTAAAYAELQAKLEDAPPPKLDTRIRDQIFLLQLLRTLKTMFPFLNFF